MVKTTLSPASRARRGRGALGRKLRRDMGRSAMQFLAIVLLCALGVWVYSGLDGTWRMLDLSIEHYFEETNLADFWVNASSFSRADLTRMKRIDGVAAIQARTSATFDVTGLEPDTALLTHATDGRQIINTPLVQSGEALGEDDLRGCMLDDAFAKANDLAVGDSITLDVYGTEVTFTIRAVIKSSEHVVTTRDVKPDPKHYGYLYISHRAVSALPFNEVMVDLVPSTDADQAERAIEELLPTAIVLTARSNASTQRIRNDVTMFKNLTYVFPVLAFAVASMVVMTTLTRMIENQRVQMGTLKALGYSDGRIRRHYLSYAFYPSLVGSLIGLLGGQYTLPDVLWEMESSHCNFPWQMRAPISLSAWAITGLAVVLSLLICLHTYNKAARETTASLLRPKPPAAGNRILLERIPFLWRHFSFNTKMIIRNLLRNKGRTAMSLVGVLCCNMLIICTLGLTDSIHFFVGTYYDGTLQYDVRADLSMGGTLESYRSRLEADVVDGIMELSVSARTPSIQRTLQMIVLKEDQTTMHLGKDASYMPLPEKGIVLSQKTSEVLGLTIGDSFEAWLPGDDEPLILTIAALADTNIGQGIFLGADQWESFHKGAFAPTALLMKNPSALTIHKLEEADEVTALKYPTEQHAHMMTILDSLSTVFSIMSGAALGLAFIICYNMGLMNFTERTRDYATLKVLGYHQREIRRLMLRENDLTAILGVLLGMAPGVLLTSVVLRSAESETMVYASFVRWQSIVIASLITFAFSWLIEWLLTRKVRRIDMVEALKSVE